jgi:hypothetical protein
LGVEVSVLRFGVGDHQERAGVSRFLLAMALFVVLGVAAWWTLDDPAMRTTRAVTLAVIAGFALRTYFAYRGSSGK